MKEKFRPKLCKLSYPTPFHELENLRYKLGIKPRIFIKRDDCTEVGLGGNKNRKLDYVMYDAVKQKADTIITWGGLQSNHCRQTLAFSKILNMDCHLVLNGEPQEKHQGNLFVFDMFGAKLHYEKEESKCPDVCRNLEIELKKAGKNPYIVPIGASLPLGSLGYVDSAKEIAEQSAAAGIKVGHIFVATGSAGTQAGLEVGSKLYIPECKIHGITVSRYRNAQQKMVSTLSNELAEFIGEKMNFKTEDICVHDEYFGGQYAVPTKAGNEAIKLVGNTEAILLDPVYTGKAMSGMIDLLKKGALDDAEAVVFVHTGGYPAIFNFVESFK